MNIIKIKLNEKCDPYHYHRIISSGFGEESYLYRLESEKEIIAIFDNKCNLNFDDKIFDTSIVSKLKTDLENGTIHNIKLRFNPHIKRQKAVIPITDLYDARDWIMKRSNNLGFEFDKNSFNLVKEESLYIKEKKYSINSFDCKSLIKIKNSVAFKDIFKGIGKNKYLGFGMPYVY